MLHDKTNIMENQQDYVLSSSQEQVLLTGYLGDGNVSKSTNNKNYSYRASSISKDLLIVKQYLLGDLSLNNIISRDNSKGYGGNSIYKFGSKSSKLITEFHYKSLEDKLSKLDKLGIALWFYDDGSLHKTNNFYNLCTHKYSREIQEELFIPKLAEFGINAKVRVENKKDGRSFYYLSIGRHDGSFEINNILRSYPINSMEYKMWSSETSREWRKLQVELKSEGKEISKRMFTNILNDRLYKI